LYNFTPANLNKSILLLKKKESSTARLKSDIFQNMRNERIKYKDFWFKITGSLIASEIIDALGREESFFYRFTTRYFYTDLLGGFAIALLLWEVVRFATCYLDKKYDWIEKPVQRILLQTILGVIVPALFSFFSLSPL
jgi:hypothetical protein